MTGGKPTRTLVRAVVFGVLAVVALLSIASSAGAQTAGPGIAVTVRDPDGEGVQGVDIEVSLGREVVGSGTTDAEGKFDIAVPEANTSYIVSLDVETLPDGLEPRDDRSQLDNVAVRGGLKPVIFPLVPADGSGGASGPAAWEKIIDLAAEGVRLGLVLAVASVGLSMIFGVTGLTNFAHGELVTFGALMAYMFSVSVFDVPFIMAGVLAVIAGAMFGYGNERLLFRPLRKRKVGNVSLIVVTIGLGIFLRNFFLILFEGSPRPYRDYTIQRAVEIGPITLRPKDFAIIAICLVVLLSIALVLQKTRIGTAMRAVADEKDLARASGIDVERVILLTWVGAGALAALGGVLQGLGDTVQWDMGFNLLLLMFAAVVLGGLGTPYGPMVGGLIIGVTSQVSTYWISTKYRIAVALVILIIAVLLRPQGILGRKERIG